MTNEGKLEANIACANLLDYSIVDAYTCNIYVQRKSDKRFSGVFDIFASAEQCLEVVKKLGGTYGTYIEGFEDNDWMWDSNELLYTGTGEVYKTYEESVSAAVIEVMR